MGAPHTLRPGRTSDAAKAILVFLWGTEPTPLLLTARRAPPFSYHA